MLDLVSLREASFVDMLDFAKVTDPVRISVSIRHKAPRMKFLIADEVLDRIGVPQPRQTARVAVHWSAEKQAFRVAVDPRGKFRIHQVTRGRSSYFRIPTPEGVVRASGAVSAEFVADPERRQIFIALPPALRAGTSGSREIRAILSNMQGERSEPPLSPADSPAPTKARAEPLPDNDGRPLRLAKMLARTPTVPKAEIHAAFGADGLDGLLREFRQSIGEGISILVKVDWQGDYFVTAPHHRKLCDWLKKHGWLQ